jgi:hypothetical protein
MNVLYESDNFLVVHNEYVLPITQIGRFDVDPARACFELIRKSVEVPDLVALSGPLACAFRKRLDGWKQNTPSQAQVEAVLDGYLHLGPVPYHYH